MFKVHFKRIAAILAQTGNSSLDIHLILISESQDWVSVHPDGRAAELRFIHFFSETQCKSVHFIFNYSFEPRQIDPIFFQSI